MPSCGHFKKYVAEWGMPFLSPVCAWISYLIETKCVYLYVQTDFAGNPDISRMNATFDTDKSSISKTDI